MTTEKDTQSQLEQARKDILWLANCLLDDCAVIRKHNLVEKFAGDDWNAFEFIESEARKLME